ncbi:hypothetical protein BC351_33185 [Paenibacillus ferrarius]|uniref:Uncharacterized protein n=1 Tax=Paenibacillus ferrarius TaxID=1469647 RepID=A0A1V4HDZ8_9BACL|nr:hypothetical protein [Paenibacillus ferrarius]OPH52189.1 hypothetical protein BC351_33185 [Paenibacillus ferrarius]
MKVRTLINLFSVVSDILEVYKDNTVDEMLKDIRTKVTGQPVASKKLKQKKYFDLEETLEYLKTSNRDDIVTYLNEYEKKQIESICTATNLVFAQRDNKTSLIDMLANHYNMVSLNNKMSERYSNRYTTEDAAQSSDISK